MDEKDAILDTAEFLEVNITSDEKTSVHCDVPHIPYILNGELYKIQSQVGDNVTVKCCHCPSDRVYRGSVRSTGNFHMHIKRRHPELMSRLHEMKVGALLERRDRLMKERKPSYHRRSRRTAGKLDAAAAAAHTVRSKLAKTASRITATTPPPLVPHLPPALTAMPTPKLKIRTAFQRHKMQQQQQQEEQQQQLLQDAVEALSNGTLRSSSSSTEYAALLAQCRQAYQPSEAEAMAMDDLPIDMPIDYSSTAKENNNNLSEVEEPTTHQQRSAVHSLHRLSIVPMNAREREETSESEGNAQGRGSTSTLLANARRSTVNDIRLVNNEQPQTTEDCVALDLSIHSDSSTSPLCRSSSGELQFLRTVRVHNDAADGGRYKSIDPHFGWCGDLFLSQLEASMRGIQREIFTRNQIESNRMCLEIAKFKHLHPSFNFHC